jgi:hypothetical protein
MACGAAEICVSWGRQLLRRALGGAWSHRAPWYMRQSLHDAMGALAAKNGEVG